jgi:hypothetical protein
VQDANAADVAVEKVFLDRMGEVLLRQGELIELRFV